MANDLRNAAEVTAALARAGLDPSGLTPIGVRPRLGEYLRQLWERRHFIWYDARQRTATKNSRQILGNVWLFLRPLLDASFYFVIFGLVLPVNRGVENFAAFLVVGVLLFRATATSISSGSAILRNNKAMIRAFNFPRASIPISIVLQNAMTAVFTMIVMCAVIIVLPPHVIPGPTWLLIVPIFVLQTLLNLGICLITSRVGFHFPDATNVLAVLSRFLMYGSGVMFPIEKFVGAPAVAAVIEANPLYQIIRIAREVLVYGTVPAIGSWLIVLAWVVALLVGGFVFFWWAEESYGRELR